MLFDHSGFIAAIPHQDSPCWKGSGGHFQFNFLYIETNVV